MIKYREGYEYQLIEDYQVQTSIKPESWAICSFIKLDSSGYLTIKEGYAWDGPSGPAIDTKNFMRGSLVHDALYQLMREKLLDYGWRKEADRELVRLCKEDGMSSIRAAWVYSGVRFGGGPAATEPVRILSAP